MRVTEAVSGPRTQSSELTGGKSASMVGFGVGKRLFAVQPGMDSPLTGRGSCVEAVVAVGSGAGGGEAVLVGNVREKVSVGSGAATPPGAPGISVNEGVFPVDEQADNIQAINKTHNNHLRISNSCFAIWTKVTFLFPKSIPPIVPVNNQKVIISGRLGHCKGCKLC
jgi:hypothetical protein